jgi:hypothetical protein
MGSSGTRAIFVPRLLLELSMTLAGHGRDLNVYMSTYIPVHAFLIEFTTTILCTLPGPGSSEGRSLPNQ